MQKPTIGRIVHYALTEYEAAAINKRRADAHTSGAVSQNSGAVIHAGNQVREGDVYPLIITRVWNENPGTVNGQVLLDGADTYWATSRVPGDGPGFYAWPTRD